MSSINDDQQEMKLNTKPAKKLMSETAVQTLFNKICNTVSSIVVAIDLDGNVRGMKSTTDLASKLWKDRPSAVIGVYDENCAFEWLVDDLKHAGVFA